MKERGLGEELKASSGRVAEVKVSNFPGWVWVIPADKEAELMAILNEMGSIDTSLYDSFEKLVKDQPRPSHSDDKAIALDREKKAIELVEQAKKAGFEVSVDSVLDTMAIHGDEAIGIIERIIKSSDK